MYIQYWNIILLLYKLQSLVSTLKEENSSFWSCLANIYYMNSREQAAEAAKRNMKMKKKEKIFTEKSSLYSYKSSCEKRKRKSASQPFVNTLLSALVQLLRQKINSYLARFAATAFTNLICVTDVTHLRRRREEVLL